MNDERTEKDLEREFWFPEQGKRLRGFIAIQGLLEQAREQPGLDYSDRWNKIGEAERIVQLIENGLTRQLYLQSVQETRTEVDRRYSRAISR